MGLEFLEDKEDGLGGVTLGGVWVEGLEEPEPWEIRDCRDLAE